MKIGLIGRMGWMKMREMEFREEQKAFPNGVWERGEKDTVARRATATY